MTVSPAIRGEDGTGLAAAQAEPLRYDHHTNEPWESTGLLVSLLPPDARVLDIGCGTGSVSRYLKEKARELIGIEPSAERAAKARERGLNVIHDHFPSQMLKPEHDFDAVVFADVLEHLSDPAEALLHAREHLKPGGCMLISIPNVAHWSIRWSLLRGRWDYEPNGLMDATHLRWFTKKSLIRLLESAGLKLDAYSVSAGTVTPLYLRGWPWRWLGNRTRDRFIRRGVRHFPTLFGWQHVVRAVPA